MTAARYEPAPAEAGAGVVRAALVAAVCVLVLAGTNAAAARTDDGFGFSSRGTRIDLAQLSSAQRARVSAAGFTELRRLSASDAVRRSTVLGRFYWYVGTSAGHTCFARGFVVKGRLEFGAAVSFVPFGCIGVGRARGSFQSLGRFPSRARPFADSSGYLYHPGDRYSRVTVLCGLAADAVARVGIVQPNGRLLTMSVTANSYCSDRIGPTRLLNVQARAIVVVDRAGHGLAMIKLREVRNRR